MSIENTFDDKTEAILNPEQISPLIDGFPKIAVVTFEESVISVFRENYQSKLIGEINACVTIPIYQICYEGKDIAVYCSTLGGPAAVALLEEMIAKGCEKFIFFGSCGVLKEDISTNSLIIPSAAYRDEGTSYHYMPASEYIEINSARRLITVLSELEVPFVCGKTWTTDAIFRETRGNMEKRKKDGCLTVEMECASIMAVAQFRGVAVYQFLYAADNLDAREWDARALDSLPQKNVNAKLLRIAFEVAIKV